MEIHFSNYSDELMNDALKHAFSFFDMKNDTYDDQIEEFISNTRETKSTELKLIIKFLIDFIEKDLDDVVILDQLKGMSMSDNHIKSFISYKQIYQENITLFKLANVKKKIKNRLEDFSYSFFVKYADCMNEKIEFRIKLNFKYFNDNGDSENLSFEVTINQFYKLFNDFGKIETMIKTLI